VQSWRGLNDFASTEEKICEDISHNEAGAASRNEDVLALLKQ
jgi:hypothetical protein